MIAYRYVSEACDQICGDGRRQDGATWSTARRLPHRTSHVDHDLAVSAEEVTITTSLGGALRPGGESELLSQAGVLLLVQTDPSDD